jgi:hypothetical protein
MKSHNFDHLEEFVEEHGSRDPRTGQSLILSHTYVCQRCGYTIVDPQNQPNNDESGPDWPEFETDTDAWLDLYGYQPDCDIQLVASIQTS